MVNDYCNNSNDFGFEKPVIKVIGLGGGGCNAVDRMLEMGYDIEGVEFIAANTDIQALRKSSAMTKLLIGPSLTKGLGSGGNPEVGERAALESADLIREALEGADVVFLTAGMGGGTGSGAISVAAAIAREVGAITIAVVSTPFSFEAGKRISNARSSLSKLASYSDTLIAIPNDQLLKISPKNVSLREAFEYADDVLRQGIIGIARLLTDTGEINVDFAHIRNMMQNGGGSLLSIGYGKGADKVSKALYQALNHPLLEHLPIENATGIIANFTGDENLSFTEVMDGLSHLQQLANNRADIVPGQMVDNNMRDEVQIILIITGIASTPINNIAQEEKKSSNSQYSDKYAKVRAVPEKIEFKVPEPVIEIMPEPEDEDEFVPSLVYSTGESSDDEGRSRKIIPTAPQPVSSIEISPVAAAAFDTFMSPLGLSGIEPASLRVTEEEDGMDTTPDLDIPTFIRRKM